MSSNTSRRGFNKRATEILVLNSEALELEIGPHLEPASYISARICARML